MSLAKDAAATVLFAAAVLFFTTLVSCNFYAILRANSVSNPPNSFQFADGWECTCGVLRKYGSYIFTSPGSDTAHTETPAVQ